MLLTPWKFLITYIEVITKRKLIKRKKT
jgi:hypothetical protein